MGTKFIPVVDDQRLPCLQDRQDAVLETAQLQRGAVWPAALVQPVLQLAPTDQMAGVGEGQDPAAIMQARIPANMIDVQMGTEHDIDRLRRDAEPRKTFQETAVAAAVKSGEERPLLVLPDTGIDQDRLARGTEHIGLDARDHHSPFKIDMVGFEKRPQALHLLPLCLRKELRDRQFKAVDVDQDVHDTVPSREMHGRPSPSGAKEFARGVCVAYLDFSGVESETRCPSIISDRSSAITCSDPVRGTHAPDSPRLRRTSTQVPSLSPVSSGVRTALPSRTTKQHTWSPTSVTAPTGSAHLARRSSRTDP